MKATDNPNPKFSSNEGLADKEVAHQTETISLKGLILSLEKSLL